MDEAFGTYRDGHVELDQTVAWQDGIRVTVTAKNGAPLGIPESDWPTSPDALRRFLADWDALEPLEITSADAAAIDAARRDVRKASVDAVRRQMGL